MKEYLKSGDIKKCLANTLQVTFEVTDACNLRCEYCGYGKFYSDYDDRKNQRLSIEKSIRFLDYLIDLWKSTLNTSINQNVYISFYGGEPLMNFSFIQSIVDHLLNANCNTRRFTFSMTTNAILLNRYMKYFIKHNFKLKIMNKNFVLKSATSLSKGEMKNVKGGMSYCDRLQEWANTYYQDVRISDGDWDDWGDYWEAHCSGN